MSATSDDVVAHLARRTRLSRLIELLWKRRRNRPSVEERSIDPVETEFFLDSKIYDEGPAESEIIFMSTMWLGM